MSLSNFPTSLDSWTGKTDNVDDVLAAHVNKLQNAVEALEAKLGIDSSAVVTSIEYVLKNASSQNPGHKHNLAAGATDVTATASEINTVCDGATAKNSHTHATLGISQTWQSPSRSSGTNYTNSTGSPIFVSAYTPGGNFQVLDLVIDSIHVACFNSGSGGGQGTVSGIVPPGVTYSITGNISAWRELR